MRAAHDILLEGTFQPDQKLSYVHLPFDVPEQTVSIEVRYEYSDKIGSDPQLTNGNTIDIGIFDIRGTAFLDAGFRGGSGSARTEFFIGTEEATPGYTPGPIQAGTWYIMLGLYKIAPQGCHYRVMIRLTTDSDFDGHNLSFPTLLPVRNAPAASKPDGWYQGELHCHTYHSDGDSDPLEVVRKAESLSLDFLAVTDHNVLTQQISLRESNTPLILIPGMEVTTFKGHWNVWGDGGWIDFRILEQAHMEQAMQAAAERGYLVSCNHPRPYGPDWVFRDVTSFDCLEVWNGPWEIFNTEALSYWEARLRAGQRCTAVGGSDCHFHHREHIAKLGQPTTWIYCEEPPSAASLLAAVRRGHVAISESPEGPHLDLRCDGVMAGDRVSRPASQQLPIFVRVRGGTDSTLQLHGAKDILATFPIDSDEWEITTRVDVTNTHFVRAQITRPLVVRAISNPIYIDG